MLHLKIAPIPSTVKGMGAFYDQILPESDKLAWQWNVLEVLSYTDETRIV